MSAAQVAKLEVLLARVRARKLEPGLRLVDVDEVHAPTETAAASVAAAAPAPVVRPAPVAAAPAPVERPAPVAAAPAPVERPAPQPAPAEAPSVPAQRASLLDLDEPVAAPPAAAAPANQRTTIDVDPEEDDLFDVDVAPSRPTPAKLELVESDDPDALVTAVARPAPVDVSPAAAPSSVAQADVGSGIHSAGPVRMEAPLPVASGPVATFTGVAKRTHALSFGELVGLAMSLTTR